MTAEIRINRAHYPVTVLGPGRRIGIWLQGCSIGCPDCLSKDTWSTDAGNLMDISRLVDWCRQYEAQGVDGITISGGEPFEQPEALEVLLRQLHAWTDRMSTSVDYLCYSGNHFRLIQEKYPHILSFLDTIIPEPFNVDLTGKPLRGSANQPVIHLTELGVSRFADLVDESPSEYGKRMQFTFEGNTVWFIGIPERGDMERMVELCKAQGLYLKNVSWES
ncbi:MAG: 4Fe-4S cluster-binding domain-containing protein [Desulfuromonadales bacterium]|nr:4Fe-4S cluster-binding domain-containing protein [Desulfuromonadales bacterium]